MSLAVECWSGGGNTLRVGLNSQQAKMEVNCVAVDSGRGNFAGKKRERVYPLGAAGNM